LYFGLSGLPPINKYVEKEKIKTQRWKMFLQEMTQNQMRETTNQWRKGSKKCTSLEFVVSNYCLKMKVQKHSTLLPNASQAQEMKYS
jgi:hypothetical protein